MYKKTAAALFTVIYGLIFIPSAVLCILCASAVAPSAGQIGAGLGVLFAMLFGAVAVVAFLFLLGSIRVIKHGKKSASANEYRKKVFGTVFFVAVQLIAALAGLLVAALFAGFEEDAFYPYAACFLCAAALLALGSALIICDIVKNKREIKGI
jgi:hypothetical protein